MEMTQWHPLTDAFIQTDNFIDYEGHVCLDNSIQFNCIYIAPKQWTKCLKALYRAQGLNPLRASTMATGARKKKPLKKTQLRHLPPPHPLHLCHSCWPTTSFSYFFFVEHSRRLSPIPFPPLSPSVLKTEGDFSGSLANFLWHTFCRPPVVTLPRSSLSCCEPSWILPFLSGSLFLEPSSHDLFPTCFSQFL